MAGQAMREQPLYREIVERLGGEIADGQYRLGSRLPTEAALCHRFQASRHTIRAALKQLQETGLIRRRQGSGSVVVSDRPQTRFASSIASIDDLMQYAASTRLEVLAADPPRPAAALSQRIGRPLEGPRPLEGEWVRIRALRRAAAPAEGAPIALTEIWLPAAFADVAPEIGRQGLPVCRLIERRHGARVTLVRQSIAAAAAEAGDAALLGLPSGAPLLCIDRIYEAASGEVLEVALNRHPADRFSYGLTLRAAG
ncbi:GntR family transcriptional regulator [Marinibaculum pumilum]|uniref:GntR family transcriptional regulator n=1 Tax=Marinibaculum pumilum TaxID=1766165 RepID=A0ABV7KZ82_9PROT